MNIHDKMRTDETDRYILTKYGRTSDNLPDAINRIALIILLFCIVLLFSNPIHAQQSLKYVGVRVCSPCHRGIARGSQKEIWDKSDHSNAYRTLESAESDRIAKETGLTTAAKDSPQCLKCHTTNGGKEGVTCESCHGPGSAYKKLSIMNDRRKALAAGMIIGTNDPELCKKCHNIESPTYKKFNYTASWRKIKHPKPIE